MDSSRERLTELVGESYFRAFRTYLRLARRIQRNVTLDVVVSRKP
jgi:hypothetical protein